MSWKLLSVENSARIDVARWLGFTVKEATASLPVISSVAISETTGSDPSVVNVETLLVVAPNAFVAMVRT